jgi:AsmA protein
LKKTIKYGLIGILSLVLVIGAIAGYVVATFDPNDIKPKLIQLVKEKKQRALKLDGELTLSIFPNIAVNLGQVWLSERESDKEFASVDHANVSLKLLPLLKKQLVINQVEIKGVRASLVRFKDGTTNIDDLMTTEEKSEQLAFDIDHVTVDGATLSYRDEGSGKKYFVDKVLLKTGRIADGIPSDIELKFAVKGNQPQHNILAQLNSRITPDFEKKNYLLERLDAEITGQFANFQNLHLKLSGDIKAQLETKEVSLSQFKMNLIGRMNQDDLSVQLEAPSLVLTRDKVAATTISAHAKLTNAEGVVTMNLSLPSLEGTAKNFKTGVMQLNLDVARGLKQVKAIVEMPLEGVLDSASMRPDLIRSSALSLKLNGNMGDQALSATLKGSMELNLGKQMMSGQLAGKLLDSKVSAKFSATGFTHPRLNFDADIDQLDLDRLMPRKATATPEQSLDFSILKKINVNGSLRVGSLRFLNIKASQVKLEIKAAAGKLEINPLSANLYRGSMHGMLAVDALATPKLTLKQNMHAVNLGNLMQDFANKDVFEGNGNLAVDVSGEGSSASTIKRTLAGTASLLVTDGAIKGINIAASLRAIKAKLGILKGEHIQSANATEKTDFSELSASFNVNKGIVHNNDLSMKSPLLRLTGAGDIDLGADRLDYGTKVTLVATSKGQGGAELESLKGVTIPLRISGPVASPSYKLDFGAMFSAAVTQKVQTKTDAVKTKVEDKLKSKLKGLLK